MPKVTSQRTFTGCWTCRRRNLRCDTAVPSCAQCARSQIHCEGYDIRLVWVDSETGTYIHEQRRLYPCEETWKGYPTWTLREVGHLIRDSEKRRCRCPLHQVASPFTTFPLSNSVRRSLSAEVGEREDTEEQGSESFEISPITNLDETECCEISIPTTPPDDEDVGCRGNELVHIPRTAAMPQELSQALTPRGIPAEESLFHHYLSNVAVVMTPIDDDSNPWRSIYPRLAVCDDLSKSSRSLLHAILAQSAFHRANLLGPVQGERDQTAAMQHYGLALRELRQSLAIPIENYSSVMAAMFMITLAEHVFQGQSRGWQQHLQGALQYMTQYLSQRPWMMSREAWTITQSFALATVISQTTVAAGEGIPENMTTRPTVRDVLFDVTIEPRFGHTLGSTARLVKAIYQTRLLEEQFQLSLESEGRCDCRRRPQLQQDHLNHDGCTTLTEKVLIRQAYEILQDLRRPLDQEIDAYVSPQQYSSRKRELVTRHLRLFNAAATIYLYRTVLRYPPSDPVVVEQVSQVLIDATALLEIVAPQPPISIWPIFIAAVEACTPTAQADADRVLSSISTICGAAHRHVVHRVVRQVWRDRDDIAAAASLQERRSIEAFVDWRAVMKKLDVEILLL